MFGKCLILLPNSDDRAESSKINKEKYETHLLHASNQVKDKTVSIFGYSEYLVKPGFLNNYVDRAVEYIKKNDITGIMYGHDLATVIASVVCEKTGLPGPSLNSTFISLHKYYSRVVSPDNLWFDYINLDDPEESWKPKMRYPCFVKAPLLTMGKGCSAIENEEEMISFLNSIRPITLPYFKGYAEFFSKYLDLKKFPLAVKNIMVVEELIECKDQYYFEMWADENGVISPYTTAVECFCNKKEDIMTGWVTPDFTLNESDIAKMMEVTKNAALRAGLRNTFFNVELWKIGSEFKVVEINCRCVSISSATYTRMFGFSNYEAAIALACGKKENIPKHPASIAYKEGEEISGDFYVLTYEEGIAKDLIDFEYARKGSGKDGAYYNHGPGIELYVTEDEVVKQTSTRGFTLCTFMITAKTPEELFDNMKKIRKKVLLCSDHPQLRIIETKKN